MDWKAIRSEFENSDITLKALAEKYSISEGTMRSRKNREKWQRNATAKKATQRKNAATKLKRVSQLKADGPKPNDLTDKQRLFVKEYLIDLNATQAAIRAGYSSNTAEQIGYQLLQKTSVQEAIQVARSQREQRTEITADMVLKRWWTIATADPNDLVHLRRLCCRHCFGAGHAYQWCDEAEYKAAIRSEIRAAKEEEREPILPSDAGGYGYDQTLRPHPKCPHCAGEGRLSIHMQDTKYTTPEGRLLYAGIKQTQAGIEIKMRNQDKALELVARHLGMFDDKANSDKPNPNAQINALADLINNPVPERVLTDD